MFRVIRRAIDRAERAVQGWHRFAGNVYYYWWICNLSFRSAIKLASVTLP